MDVFYKKQFPLYNESGNLINHVEIDITPIVNKKRFDVELVSSGILDIPAIIQECGVIEAGLQRFISKNSSYKKRYEYAQYLGYKGLTYGDLDPDINLSEKDKIVNDSFIKAKIGIDPTLETLDEEISLATYHLKILTTFQKTLKHVFDAGKAHAYEVTRI